MRLAALLLLILVVLAPEDASAIPVTYSFTGIAFDQFGIFERRGTAVTGFYAINSVVIDIAPSNTQDSFADYGLTGAAWEISVTNGGITRSTSSNQNGFGNLQHRLDVRDTPSEDRWELRSRRFVPSDDIAQLLFRDFATGGVDPDAIATGSGNLTGALITSPGDPGLYSSNLGRYLAYTDSGDFEGELFFAITSITLVPEPRLALLGLIALVGVQALRRA